MSYMEAIKYFSREFRKAENNLKRAKDREGSEDEIENISKKLNYYEMAISALDEQRVSKFIVDIGDTVYSVSGYDILEWKVKSIGTEVNSSGVHRCFHAVCSSGVLSTFFDEEAFNATVFKNREDAEEVVSKMPKSKLENVKVTQK